MLQSPWENGASGGPRAIQEGLLPCGSGRLREYRAYRAAGISARVPQGALVHALRHTFATRLAEDGASATEIQRLLGHEDLKTSQGYIDSTATEQRAAVRSNRTYRALEGLLGPEPPGHGGRASAGPVGSGADA